MKGRFAEFAATDAFWATSVCRSSVLGFMSHLCTLMGHKLTSKITGMNSQNSTSTKAGRPPGFPIHGATLRALRKERGLSQADLGMCANPDGVTEVESRTKACRRWEKRGLMKDRATAERVAEILGTTVAFLQGGAPEPAPNRVLEIEQQLRRQADAGNLEARAMLANGPDDEDPQHAVAEKLATRLELAQLTRQTTRLNELAKLTGWSLRELEQPANRHGYWLIASETPMGTSTTQIVVDVDTAIWAVHQEIMGWLRPQGAEQPSPLPDDARLAFSEEAPWFRVRLEHPRREWANRTLSLVRCEPGEAGLKWTAPARYDRHQIERLPFRFWSDVNLIEGLAAGSALQDLRQLRLIIERFHPKVVRKALTEGKLEPLPEIVAVVEGDLPQLDDDRLGMFRDSGESHALVVNWIAQGLWLHLQQEMEQWPRECWKLHAYEAAIGIELETRPYLAMQQLGRLPRSEVRYRISVVELMKDGSVRNQPWRRESVVHTISVLELYMRDLAAAPPLDQLFVGPPRPEGLANPCDD